MHVKPSDIGFANCWIELDSGAYRANVAQFRNLLGDERALMAVVKANAYGHGLVPTASLAQAAGVDWLGVFSVAEGLVLREHQVDLPILVMGPSDPGQLSAARDAGLRLTVTQAASAAALAATARPGDKVHLKIETGTHRQGLTGEDLLSAVSTLQSAGIAIEGAYTHFADIEDTTEHSFARGQLQRFEQAVNELATAGVPVPLPHTACSAAAILFPSTYFKMARVGISLYGLWPSRETRVSARGLGRGQIALRPVLSWKTRIAQTKNLAAGEFVGYGRTFRTTRPSRIAVLPIGYADGYDRRLSGAAHVLIDGVRAPVRGRICMNLTMVDITDIPNAQVGDEVVLLGSQGDETISAEDLAAVVGTINYEIVTRLSPAIPRVVMSSLAP